MKLAAVIVVFKPDIEFLRSNILSLIDDVDQVIVYENSKINLAEINLKKTKITYLGSGENLGIAKALNEAVSWAELNNYSHLLTLDQDSSFFPQNLEKFKNLIENEIEDTIGVFCPNISNRGKLLTNSSSPKVQVVDSITSGSIFPLSTFQKCGKFDELLFIDAVDYEYCYRIFTNNNLKTVVYPDIVLKHEVGYPTRIRFGFTTDNYSAFRTYFIVRNQLIIWRRYPKLFQPSYKITLVKIHIIFRFIKIILGEEDKVNKLKSIVRGVYHGLTNK